MKYESTKIIELGSCAFRQWRADSHCKFIHGYRLVAKFWFACDRLDDKNWVVDFGGLKNLKEILEKQFDHTLCIAGDDPLLASFKELHKTGAVDLRIMEKGVGIERTAEYCFDVADAYVRGITNNRCWVDKVEVWEHDKNSAIVYFANESITPVVPITTPNIEQVTVTGAGINIEVPTSAGGQVQAIPLKREIRAAPVGNKVTTGLSNPFAGTSWGN
jgi:6-pyruvoyltetrahydropterin/6-carboxytetrahydropterin synthase